VTGKTGDSSNAGMTATSGATSSAGAGSSTHTQTEASSSTGSDAVVLYDVSSISLVSTADGLTHSLTSLTPSFRSGHMSYTAVIPFGTTRVSVSGIFTLGTVLIDDGITPPEQCCRFRVLAKIHPVPVLAWNRTSR
jgi:hypothetical protein